MNKKEQNPLLFIQRLAIISIPATYLAAGIGMLISLVVNNADGDFFERIQNYEFEWIASHILLLIGTTFIIPGAIAMREMIDKRMACLLADVSLITIIPSTLLLSGQYAIDFVLPLIAKVGGDAYENA